MLDRTNYGFCHEFYAVEKAIEVAVEQGGEPLQLRIEAPEGFLISPSASRRQLSGHQAKEAISAAETTSSVRFIERLASQVDAGILIHGKHPHCYPARRGFSEKVGTPGLKMFVPRLKAGVEERLDSPGLRVDAGQVRALVEVALRTRKGEVALGIGTAVLLRDDVLHLIGEERLVLLVGVAVFATVPGPLPDPLPDWRRNHAVCLCCRTERALA
jgi:hypothetical protein